MHLYGCNLDIFVADEPDPELLLALLWIVEELLYLDLAAAKEDVLTIAHELFRH